MATQVKLIKDKRELAELIMAHAVEKVHKLGFDMTCGDKQLKVPIRLGAVNIWYYPSDKALVLLIGMLTLLVGCQTQVPVSKALTPPMPFVSTVPQYSIQAPPIVVPIPTRSFLLPIEYPKDMTNYFWYIQCSPDNKTWTNLNNTMFYGPPSGTYTVTMPTNTSVFFWRLYGRSKN